MKEEEYTNPQYIVDMIDNEGWPDALDWLVNNKYEDEKVDDLIYEAYENYTLLENVYKRLQTRLKEIGVEWYI